MQKKQAKGLFINSSYRRPGILKTLRRGFRHSHEQAEGASRPPATPPEAASDPQAEEARLVESGGQARGAASR